MCVRDVPVELARILAAATVIGVHTFIGSQVGGSYDFSRILIACFVADGVGVFWMITGFFALSSGGYGKTVIRTIKRVLVPMVFLSIVVFFFYDWLLGREPLVESVRHTSEEWWRVVQSIFTWQNGVEGAGHLWYVYTYCFLVLILPVITPFVRYLDESPKAERGFLVITFCLLALNDATQNHFLEFGYHTIDSVVPAAILATWGHIFYKHRACFAKKKFVLPAVLLFAAVNLMRAAFVCESLNAQGVNTLQYWYTTFGLASACCLLVFCFAIASPLNENDGSISRFITSVGGLTFSIYLVHVLIIALLRRIDFIPALRGALLGECSSFFQEAIYTAVVVAIVFAGSLFLAYFLRQICLLAKSCASRLGLLRN